MTSRSPVLRGPSAASVSAVALEPVVVDAAQLLSIRDKATQEGYDAGYHAGQEAARIEAERAATQAAATLAQAVRALEAAVSQAQQTLQTEQSRLDRAACRLAVGVAEAVLAREIAGASDPGLDAVHRAVAEVPMDGPATARLHPDDLAAIDASALPADLKLIADPAIAPGGCVLDAGAAIVDARVDAALARVREVLDLAVAE